MPDGEPHLLPDSEPWPPGRQYLAVRRTIEEEWERCAFQLREFPALTEMRQRGFDPIPLSLVLSSEWSAAWHQFPTGDLVRAWVRDAGGLRAIPKEEFERLASQDRHARPRYSSVGFHVCDDGRHVVYAVILGRLAAHGGKCWIDPADPRLSGARWIS